MFSSLRRQSPVLLRLRATSSSLISSSAASLQALTSASSSATLSRPILTGSESRTLNSALQARFFTCSSLRKYEANAATATDSDPPVSEYASHHVADGTVPEPTAGEPLIRFEQLWQRGLVDKNIITPITRGMGFEEMTKVQRKTILETVGGRDVLAQAKTGTGKTIAFLLPVLQRIQTSQKPLKPPPRTRGMNQNNLDIRALVISPTRELALQIANDAHKLIKNTNIVVQVAVGGVGKREGLIKMHREGCNLLIATPGRLNDLLTDPMANVKMPDLEVLVLDEADNLLDQGFSAAIEDIVRLLPPRDAPVAGRPGGRQTLLFSATVPDKVLDVVRKTLKKDYKYLKMVEKGEENTHQRVEQRLVRCKGFESYVPSILELCQREVAAVEASHRATGRDGDPLPPFKAIVFFPVTRLASFTAEAFRNLNGPYGEAKVVGDNVQVFEIHSRLSQSQRTRTADAFRRAKSGILFSSDVVARGMDFPNVTHVIQVGSPSNEEQYIHRLGRTARGNKSGIGYLLLSEIEYPHAMRDLRKMRLMEDKTLVSPTLNLASQEKMPKGIANNLDLAMKACTFVRSGLKQATFHALMGYYSSFRDKSGLVRALNDLACVGWGMPSPPATPKNLAMKLGFSNVRELVIGPRMESGDRDWGFEGRSSVGGFRDRDGERKGFGARSFDRGGRGERGSFGDRSFGDRSFDDRNFGDRSFDDRNFGDRRSDWGDRGERKSFGNRSFGNSGSNFGGNEKKKSPIRGDRSADGTQPHWMGRGNKGSKRARS